MTLISVAIPTRNRSDLLFEALQSLLRQEMSVKDFEVIVVDNGSTDDTATTAQGIAPQFPNFQYIYDDRPGLHVGRHRGLMAARSPIIVYADDDIIAGEKWLTTLQDLFLDPDVVIAGGNNVPLFLRSPPKWLEQLWNEFSSFENGKALAALSLLEMPAGRRPIDPRYVWGCNYGARVDFIKTVGGFRPDGMPQNLIAYRGDGESHLSREAMRLQKIAMFDTRASIQHKVTQERMSLEFFGKRAYAQGISDSFSEIKRGSGAARRAGRQVKSVLRTAVHMLSQFASSDLRSLATLQYRQYWRGYDYHQKCYQRDPKVKAWVDRSSYFD